MSYYNALLSSEIILKNSIVISTSSRFLSPSTTLRINYVEGPSSFFLLPSSFFLLPSSFFLLPSANS
ncbi:MAG: hypothetical protein QQW96_00205 [Tychonema bourrellyi B0820]|nr:hypothetical protein [Tychonema bourrellyi B0820]